MSEREHNREEEIDLIEFIRLVKRNVISLIKGLVNVLGGLFLFFKKTAILFIGAAILGGALGWLSYFLVPKPYAYKIIIECNTDYVDVLYRKVDYLNIILDQNNSSSILKDLNVSEENVDAIKGFEIEPVNENADIANLYWKYIERHSADTAFSPMSLEAYANTKSKYSLSKHQLILLSENILDYKSTLNELLTQTLKTKSIEESRNKKLNLISKKKEALESVQNETSSNLIIIQEEIDSSPSSNNLENLIGSYSSLLLKQLEINLSLAELEEQLDMQDYIYTIIEDYTVQPYQKKEGRVFIGAGIAVTFLLLALILIELNKFFLKRSSN